MIKKFYYERHLMTHDGHDNKREAFYTLLKHIQDKAITVNTAMGGFYDEITYTMNNGEKWLYVYDIENGIPYSLELLKK